MFWSRNVRLPTTPKYDAEMFYNNKNNSDSNKNNNDNNNKQI